MQILFVVKDIDYIDPIGIMTLSSLAKSKGHTVRLGILSRENILKKIKDLKIDLVAYSASTGEHKYYLGLNDKIKSNFKDVFTIMGGPHTTFYPECIEKSSLDAICVGEGEDAFLELLGKLENKKDIRDIQNIITKSGKNNGLRNLFQDLDNLSFPDRELFYESTEMRDFGLKSFIASRGCPYQCTYCFEHAFRKLYSDKGKLVRRHSVEYVIEEVKRVKQNYRLEFVKFYDDVFSYRVDEWFEKFVKLYKKEINLPFQCLTRADLLTDDMAKLLKEAGCFSLSMSIEAGNPQIRNDLLKRNMANDEIIKAFDICNKYKINTFANNILGLPYATIENEIETLDLNLKCKVSFAEFPIFHPYPRTELGDFCMKEGIYSHHYEDLHMSYMNRSPLSCFTERQKNIQRNLSRLGNLVLMFPSLRNLVVKHLIYWRYNFLFFAVYYITKVYLVKVKIYPLKPRLVDVIRFFIKSFRLERFKLSDER